MQLDDEEEEPAASFVEIRTSTRLRLKNLVVKPKCYVEGKMVSVGVHKVRRRTQEAPEVDENDPFWAASEDQEKICQVLTALLKLL